MTKYKNTDTIVNKLTHACQGTPMVDLQWDDTMNLLRESLDEITRLHEELRVTRLNIRAWDKMQYNMKDYA